jgi:hypothetical protein
MFVERCCISFGVKSNGSLGGIFSFLIVVGTSIAHLIIFNKKNFENDRLYCTKLLTVVDHNITNVEFVAIAIQFTVSLLDFLLLLYNKQKIQEYK